MVQILTSSRRIPSNDWPNLPSLLTTYSHVTYDLSVGSTHFGMSGAVKSAICADLQGSAEQYSYFSKYGSPAGLDNLRKLWANIIVNGYTFTGQFSDGNLKQLPDLNHLFPNHEFMITAGANQAFVNTILATCDVEDEVLLVLPYYFSHVTALAMANVRPVFVPVDEKTFFPSIPDIQARVSSKSKALVVVNPGNPSGRVFPKQLLEQIDSFCKQNSLWLILDEAYRELVYEGPDKIVFSPLPNDNIIKMYTMSKVYGLAGFRVGGLLYPKRLSKTMVEVQDTIPTNVSHMCQRVAYHALKQNPFELGPCENNLNLMNKVRLIFAKELHAAYDSFGLSHRFVIPNGAFFFFLPYSNAENLSQKDDLNTVRCLALEHSIFVLPGYLFGMCGYVRLSYGSVQLAEADLFAEKVRTALSSSLSETCQPC